MALVARFEEGAVVKRKDSKVQFPRWIVVNTNFTKNKIAICTLIGLSGDINMRRIHKIRESELEYV